MPLVRPLHHPWKRWRRALAIAALLASRAAVAAPAPAPDAEAVVSFDEGRKLMGERRFVEAALRFEESLRHARSVGALLNLARCYEESGRAASAWATYRAAASLARELHDAREADANRFAEGIRDRRSTLTLDASALAGVEGARVRRDGIEVGATARGEPSPVDPGEHVVEVSAPGRVTWRGTARVGPNADAAKLRIPALLLAPSATRADEPVPFATAAAPSPLARTLGFVALGAGVVGLGVGGAAGGVALARHHDATAACPSYPDHCPSSGAADGPNAASQTWATASTVGFIAGGAAVATGVVLLLVAPRAERPAVARVTPLVTSTEAGVVLGGSW